MVWRKKGAQCTFTWVGEGWCAGKYGDFEEALHAMGGILKGTHLKDYGPCSE
jgi:hypothetical protein